MTTVTTDAARESCERKVIFRAGYNAVSRGPALNAFRPPSVSMVWN